MGVNVQSYYTALCKPSFQQNVLSHAEKQESVASTQGKQSIETILGAQTSGQEGAHFKAGSTVCPKNEGNHA